MEKSIINIVDSFNEAYEHFKQGLSFSFNAIDAAKPNENGHSKILANLLKYKSGNEYPFLASFFLSLGDKMNYLSKQISQPIVYAEKGRVDVSIRDKDYVVIIENKIHYAVEQDHQVDGYIDFVKRNYGFDKIYVLYLTRKGGKPSENSLKKEYWQALGDRYIAINYKEHILPWLKCILDEKIEAKDDLLRAGLMQYIDHLEGLFYMRENMKTMNSKLKQELSEKLDLDEKTSAYDKQLEIVKFKKKLDLVGEYADKLLQQQVADQWQTLKESLKEELNSYQIIPGTSTNGNYWWIGIKAMWGDEEVLLGIGYDNLPFHKKMEKQYLPYLGLSTRGCTNQKIDVAVLENIKLSISDNLYINTHYWYRHRRVAFESVVEEYVKLLTELKEKKLISVV